MLQGVQKVSVILTHGLSEHLRSLPKEGLRLGIIAARQIEQGQAIERSKLQAMFAAQRLAGNVESLAVERFRGGIPVRSAKEIGEALQRQQ